MGTSRSEVASLEKGRRHGKVALCRKMSPLTEVKTASLVLRPSACFVASFCCRFAPRVSFVQELSTCSIGNIQHIRWDLTHRLRHHLNVSTQPILYEITLDQCCSGFFAGESDRSISHTSRRCAMGPKCTACLNAHATGLPIQQCG